MDEPIGIVAALREEVGPLVSRLAGRSEVRVGSRRFARGTLAGGSVLVGACGDGWRNAEEGARDLLSSGPVRGLVGFGVAGALSPELREGDVVAGRVVTDTAGASALSSHASWLNSAIRCGARAGSIVTSRSIVSAPAEKARLLGSVGAGEVGVVDLESYPWAKAASDAGQPFLVIRAVLDTADEDVPAAVGASQRCDGSVDRLRVALRAMARPRDLGRLLALGRRLDRSAVRLADFVEAFLTGLRGAAPDPRIG
jgi:adenosylhomocysteine nucleosidase